MILIKCIFKNRFPNLLNKALYTQANSVHQYTRNIAIVAHVDHGKTSLVNSLLEYDVDFFKGKLNMDYNELEVERGITILSKCTTMKWFCNDISTNPYTINIIDTPGHADFGGEVERSLSLVDGIVLVVDANEGPMIQTKKIMELSLKKNLNPIVVLNKMDRILAQNEANYKQILGKIDSMIFDLFANLGANEDQLNYKTIYVSAKEKWATFDIRDVCKGDMSTLLKTIISFVPYPKIYTGESPLLIINGMDQDHDNSAGIGYFGKLIKGKLRKGDPIKIYDPELNLHEETRISNIHIRKGHLVCNKSEAYAGELINISGITKPTSVNWVVCGRNLLSNELDDVKSILNLNKCEIDPPTTSMLFFINTSPLKGKEGKNLTTKILLDLLSKQVKKDPSLKILPGCTEDCFELLGRGQLHFGILIENIRREGYELAISKPKVVLQEIEGFLKEPMAQLNVEMAEEFIGYVIEELIQRKGELIKTIDLTENNKPRLQYVFSIPIRGLIGFNNRFKDITRGSGTLSHIFTGYENFKGQISSSRKGCIISTADGICSKYALSELEPRGLLFVTPGTNVYQGMIIGEANRPQDVECNPTKLKETSNVRSIIKDESIVLKSPLVKSLEDYISYIADDELLEITPISIRLRKKILNGSARRAELRRGANHI